MSGSLSVLDERLLEMLLVQMLGQVEDVPSDWDAAAHISGRTRASDESYLNYSRYSGLGITHLSNPVAGLPDVPLQVHAGYTRVEVLAACGVKEWAGLAWREGVRFVPDVPADLLVFTLNKTKGHFSPTTRYRDYAISRELIHWGRVSR